MTPCMRWPGTKPDTARRSRGCWRGISGSKKNQVNQGFSWGDIEGCHPFFHGFLPTRLVHFLYIKGQKELKISSKPPNLVHPKSCTIWQSYYTINQLTFQQHLQYKNPSRIKHPAYISETSLNPSVILVLSILSRIDSKKRTKTAPFF